MHLEVCRLRLPLSREKNTISGETKLTLLRQTMQQKVRLRIWSFRAAFLAMLLLTTVRN